jgi:hypothetical protein
MFSEHYIWCSTTSVSQRQFPLTTRKRRQKATMPSQQDFFAKLEAWENSMAPCRSESCPIKTPHNEGRYLHKGQRSNRNPTFGSCNPSPEVWAAYNQMKGGRFTQADKQVVEGFRDNHVFQNHCRFAGSTGKRRWFAEKRVLPWGSSGDFQLP